MSVIAESEDKARALANGAIGSAKSGHIQSRELQTHIVGVTAHEGITRVYWDKPYLHRHMTLCEQSEIPAGIVMFGRQAIPRCPSCSCDEDNE